MSRLRRITGHLKDWQVEELQEANRFSRQIGLALAAHLTFRWTLSRIGDDPDGRLFARYRERFGKALPRRGIRFAAIWVRESKPSDAGAEHFHLLFHLPAQWRSEQRLAEVGAQAEDILRRISGAMEENALKITLQRNGDIRYLLKGARPAVQCELRIKRDWREPQGEIFGKRAGFTQNLGPAARDRFYRRKAISQQTINHDSGASTNAI